MWSQLIFDTVNRLYHSHKNVKLNDNIYSGQTNGKFNSAIIYAHAFT